MMQDGIIDSFLTVGVGGSLSSTVHQIGFVVLIHISSLASQFDVEIAPSNPDSFSAGFVISRRRIRGWNLQLTPVPF